MNRRLPPLTDLQDHDPRLIKKLREQGYTKEILRRLPNPVRAAAQRNAFSTQLLKPKP